MLTFLSCSFYIISRVKFVLYRALIFVPVNCFCLIRKGKVENLHFTFQTDFDPIPCTRQTILVLTLGIQGKIFSRRQFVFFFSQKYIGFDI